MNNQIIWKAFKISDIFERSKKHEIENSRKECDIKENKNDDYVIRNVTASRKNNAIDGYLKDEGDVKIKKLKGFLTLSANANSHCFYQNDWFVSTGDNNVLIFKNEQFKIEADKNINIYFFLAKCITYIFSKTGINRFGWKISRDFNDHYILLPLIQSDENNYIFEIDNSFFSLATEYINEIMQKAKEKKELRTKKKYEEEKKKYEEEKKKYEEDYQLEQKSIFWKAFKISDIFERSKKHKIKDSIKNLDYSKNQTNEYKIRNITATKKNNGIDSYLKDEGDVETKKHIGYLTIGSDASLFCFYQNDYFVSTGHNNLLEFKNEKLKTLADSNLFIYHFFAKNLTWIFNKFEINRFNWAISNDFNDHYILLPFFESKEQTKNVFELGNMNEKYAFATNTINYLWCQSQIKAHDRKIHLYNENIRKYEK